MSSEEHSSMKQMEHSRASSFYWLELVHNHTGTYGFQIHVYMVCVCVCV